MDVEDTAYLIKEAMDYAYDKARSVSLDIERALADQKREHDRAMSAAVATIKNRDEVIFNLRNEKVPDDTTKYQINVNDQDAPF